MFSFGESPPMKCIVVTPEKTVLTQETTFVVLPLADGEYGVLPNHAPVIARLGAGELRLTGTDGQLTHYYLEGGFAEVLGDTIALLTMYSIPAEDLDLAEAESELEELESVASETALAGIRQKKLNFQRAKIRVAKKMAEQRGNR
ncbi:MAG: ATP synthase F1 subunit epsilon [Planctomycetaceae bacterium]|jgi:F-type H+-transporting ATPase subunit epsilon|nr:ATP synthase F1 subunit epsilon [Planctomycetaceae bacterium]